MAATWRAWTKPGCRWPCSSSSCCSSCSCSSGRSSRPSPALRTSGAALARWCEIGTAGGPAALGVALVEALGAAGGPGGRRRGPPRAPRPGRAARRSPRRRRAPGRRGRRAPAAAELVEALADVKTLSADGRNMAGMDETGLSLAMQIVVMLFKLLVQLRALVEALAGVAHQWRRVGPLVRDRHGRRTRRPGRAARRSPRRRRAPGRRGRSAPAAAELVEALADVKTLSADGRNMAGMDETGLSLARQIVVMRFKLLV